MFGKKEEKPTKPAELPPANIPRANVTTWRQRWEYKLEQMPLANDPSELLNNLGREGWELVSAYPLDLPAGKIREFFFKRPP